MSQKEKKEKIFSPYQTFIVAIIAIIQFSVILDFMVLSPLGAILMKEMSITTKQFSVVVSAYAISAGISGLCAAGFADKFDRKKFLLFFYAGFILGTLCCAIAPTYNFLLAARIITGIFGGVIGSVSMAIISDLFKMEVRGRVMGFIQTAFAASQILGIPVGLVLANNFGWHSAFWMIVIFSIFVWIVIAVKMQPVNAHLQLQSDRKAYQHLLKTISKKHYVRGFIATSVMATGGFMLMPFGSAFSIHNLGLQMSELPTLYAVTGIFTIIFGPLIGKASDKIGKYKMFVIGSFLSMIMVLIYTNLTATPLWELIIINVILFAGISSRMISASALLTAIPDPVDRGAFMSINSSVQQISGGIAAFFAGLIVTEGTGGMLYHYNILGYIVCATMIIGATLLFYINRFVAEKIKSAKVNIVLDEPVLSE